MFRDHVSVVTGASSGIGRATALELARRGAAVVASARNEAALTSLADGSQDLAGEIVAHPADVTDGDGMRSLADAAVSRFGRIDSWVNAAAVAMYAPLEKTEPDELRRLLDVNVVGTANGIGAALGVMRGQGCGVIVNVGSVESRRALPLQSAYAASKHAVKGLTEALRVELEEDGVPVELVLVMPSSINTPFFRHARSKIGVLPRPFPPVYQPEVVADAIVEAIAHPVPEIVVGGGGKALQLAERLSPSLVDRLLGFASIGHREQLADQPDDGLDNLDAPLDEPGSIHGEWDDMARDRSWYTTLYGRHPNRSRLALVATAAGIGLLLWRRS